MSSLRRSSAMILRQTTAAAVCRPCRRLCRQQQLVLLLGARTMATTTTTTRAATPLSSFLSTRRVFFAHARRPLSSGGWNQRGYDLTFDSLTFGNRPKCILQGYGPSGFDVFNIVKKMDPNEVSDGTIHIHGSVVAFPHGCFLWKVERPPQVTLESLAPVFLHYPPIEMLFLGVDTDDDDDDDDDGNKSHGRVRPMELNRIRLACQERNIVLETKRVADCIGHFNILNAEDRQVAVALVLNPDEDAY